MKEKPRKKSDLIRDKSLSQRKKKEAVKSKGKKGGNASKSVQQSIPYIQMYKDGLCRVKELVSSA